MIQQYVRDSALASGDLHLPSSPPSESSAAFIASAALSGRGSSASPCTFADVLVVPSWRLVERLTERRHLSRRRFVDRFVYSSTADYLYSSFTIRPSKLRASTSPRISTAVHFTGRCECGVCVLLLLVVHSSCIFYSPWYCVVLVLSDPCVVLRYSTGTARVYTAVQ